MSFIFGFACGSVGFFNMQCGVLRAVPSGYIQIHSIDSFGKTNRIEGDNVADSHNHIIRESWQHETDLNSLNNQGELLHGRIFCAESEYCVGSLCDFNCTNDLSNSNSGLDPGFGFFADVEDSKCHFHYIKRCNDCACVKRTPQHKSEKNRRSCEPCQFRSIGWMPYKERQKCKPEICPLFFPKSCGIDFFSAKNLADLLSTTVQGGLWMSLIGDSITRGVFLKAVSFLSIRTNHIQIPMNTTSYTYDHFICCDAKHVDGRGNELDGCKLSVDKHDSQQSLPDAVAKEFRARKQRGDGVPVCLSWQWNKAPKGLLVLFDDFEKTYAKTGIRPATIAFNPGLHNLNPVSFPVAIPASPPWLCRGFSVRPARLLCARLRKAA